ncbi:MAG TPA: hypothetical protein VF719_02200, partial [Abditibacteriaceae bacterium]
MQRFLSFLLATLLTLGLGAQIRADELVLQYGQAQYGEQPLAWSPDGEFLATCDAQSTRLWHVPSGELRRVLRGGGIPVWSPDGALLAVGDGGDLISGNSMIRVWKVPEMQLKSVIRRAALPAWSRDSQTLALSIHGDKWEDPSLGIWERATNKLVSLRKRAADAAKVPLNSYRSAAEQNAWSEPFQEQMSFLTLSPDGKWIATATKDYGSRRKTERITLWNAQSGRRVKRFQSEGTIRSLAFAPNGQLFVGESETQLWRLDVQTGAR